MTDDWHKGYASGFAAQGMVVAMKAPDGTDAREWISGFLSGRRTRQGKDLMDEIDEAADARHQTCWHCGSEVQFCRCDGGLAR